MSGTLIGPALGPFVGGIIVTFRSWRDIFWLQTALAGTATLLVLFFQPETIHYKRTEELEGMPRSKKAYTMWQWLNPFRIIRLYRYPNLLTVVSVIIPILFMSLLTLVGPCFVVLSMEHVFSPNTNSLRPKSALQPDVTAAIGTILHRTWLWLLARHFLRRSLG